MLGLGFPTILERIRIMSHCSSHLSIVVYTSKSYYSHRSVCSSSIRVSDGFNTRFYAVLSGFQHGLRFRASSSEVLGFAVRRFGVSSFIE